MYLVVTRRRVRLFAVVFLLLAIVPLPAPRQSRAASPDIVISQVYASGQDESSPLPYDYVELFNPTVEDVVVDDWSLQTAAAQGHDWRTVVLNGVAPADGHYLVRGSGRWDEAGVVSRPDALGSRQMHGPDARDAALLAPLRTVLGPEAFAAAQEVGHALSVPHAVQEAQAFAADSVGGSSPRAPQPGVTSGLTARELDELRLLVEGRSDREIGETLFIGTRTVQTHVANLFTKLGVNARAEAAAVAVRRGLV